MARCLVLLLQVTEQGIAVERGADGLDFLPARELPPMTLPQALLPEGARFVGAGIVGEDDAYLFLLRGGRACRARPRAEVLEDSGAPGTHPALPLLARLALTSAQPQDFRLWPAEDGWRMESRDLDEEIAGEKGPLF